MMQRKDVPGLEVHTTEVAFQQAGASIIYKLKQDNGLFTVFGLTASDTAETNASPRDSSRHTVDRAMTSGR